VTISKFFDRVIVINLKRRIDRLEQFTKEAERIGFEFEVHEALDAKELNMDPIVAGRLSHAQVLRKIKPNEMVLICEDDAIFRDDFNEMLGEYMVKLPKDWDILYLGAIKNDVKPVNSHWVRQVESTGTHAYCVNPDKVDLFIHIARENEKWIDVAYRLWADRTNAYITHPNLVIQSDGFSDLRECDTVDFKGFR
jgi:GR25 family glycosyltransferase involved in LPS biosynthesis